MIEVEKDYASRGQANLNTVLGSLGTASFAMPILGGLLGGGWNGCNAAAACSENMAVNRYELNMQRELTNKDMEIAYLKGRDAAKSDSLELYRYVDGKFAAVERELADQRVFNATQIGTISCMQGQIAQLMDLTKLVVPNGSICPGWGDVTVSVTPAATTGA